MYFQVSVEEEHEVARGRAGSPDQRRALPSVDLVPDDAHVRKPVGDRTRELGSSVFGPVVDDDHLVTKLKRR